LLFEHTGHLITLDECHGTIKVMGPIYTPVNSVGGFVAGEDGGAHVVNTDP